MFRYDRDIQLVAIQEGPMLPHDQMVVISLSDCHAVVSRYRQGPDGSLRGECARNAAELEADAINSLVARGAQFIGGAAYPCPAELAARAEWT
jgi:hypothetical protein